MWKKQFEDELKDIRKRLYILEKDSHPIRDFVRCERCKKKIKEK
tara:strand:+ start:239 stop:370 length:132 start_codon:yes stop_codon:yes gene_type:complete